jgi:hypothetical protein
VVSDIVREGKLEPATRIDRGEPLLRSETEWRERARPHRRRIDRSGWVITAVWVGVPLILIVGALVLMPDFIGLPIIIGILGILMAIFMVFSAVAERFHKKEVASTPPEGLYENGVQLFYFIFVPYEEISRVDKGVERGTSVIVIRLHGHEDVSIKERQPWVWNLPTEFLGEDGIEELRNRLHGPGSPE